MVAILSDDVEARNALRLTRASAWARTVGPAVLDEAQKEPTVFEKVKYAFDAGEVDFSVLLGSSRLRRIFTPDPQPDEVAP